MLAFDNDQALAHLLIAATAIPVRKRGRWLRGIAAQLEPPQAPSGKAARPARGPIGRGALRQRLHKARQAAGRAVLRVEVDFTAISGALFDAGLLEEGEIDDPEAVSRALEKAVAVLPERLSVEE
jgi:hypothetical protein